MSSHEELPDVDTLSDEAFDAAFDDMMRTPNEEDSDDTPEEVIETPEPTESDSEDNDEETSEEEPEEDSEDDVTVEQPEDTEEDSTPEPDEGEVIEDTEGKTEDSTNEEEDTKAFDFTSMPMDALLPMEIKANGMKMKATMNELVAGFQKGMDYTQKMQELSGVKKLVSIATSNSLSEEDLNLLVEAKNGNKEAIAKLMSNSGIDPLDVDTDEHKDYIPDDYSKEEVDVELSSIVATINSDIEYKGQVEGAINNMPQDMYDTIAGSAGNMESLYKDVKAGVYAQVMPEVIKLQNLYGKTEATLDTYIKVARQLQGNDTPEVSRESSTEKADRNSKRKKVAPTSKAPTKKSYISKDVSKLGEDDFDREFARITGRSLNDYK